VLHRRRLPHLPFAAGGFDLVLSSHLLFSYADQLGFAFHRDALLELVRVACGEVRVFPLVAMGTAPYPLLPELLTELRDHGIAAHIVDVDYEFQAGGTRCCSGAAPTRPRHAEQHRSVTALLTGKHPTPALEE
jgi:hypothetical protein